ncbi:hypothetical protein EDB83DRAFT_1852596 [Lactarius deliciosus]|nr:hypothetical protein EDB83DRAFT_1852596 [Lactarius deliciosus]
MKQWHSPLPLRSRKARRYSAPFSVNYTLEIATSKNRAHSRSPPRTGSTFCSAAAPGLVDFHSNRLIYITVSPAIALLMHDIFSYKLLPQRWAFPRRSQATRSTHAPSHCAAVLAECSLWSMTRLIGQIQSLLEMKSHSCSVTWWAQQTRIPNS